jgi:hypothetical protein
MDIVADLTVLAVDYLGIDGKSDDTSYHEKSVRQTYQDFELVEKFGFWEDITGSGFNFTSTFF